MSKERRLGRGLEALLGRPADSLEQRFDDRTTSPVAGSTSLATMENSATASVHQIDSNPYQPRRDFLEEDIAELSESLKSHGMLQPVVVRKIVDRFQLIAGERRLRAAIKAGWTTVPIQVRDVDDRGMAELAIVENLQRKDLNALEKAASFQQYLHQYACTQEELAGRLKIDRSTIANLIRLLELPEPVQQSLRRGTISPGHARALLPLGDEREQIDFCQRIQSEGLSVRATEQLISDAIRDAEAEPEDYLAATPAAIAPRAKRTHQLAALEQELRHALGAKVDIRVGARERGKIVIYFSDHDEFDRLRELLVRDLRARIAG